MLKELKELKNNVLIVTADEVLNKKMMDSIQSEKDCFGTFSKDFDDCRTCSLITELENKRDKLWVICAWVTERIKTKTKDAESLFNEVKELDIIKPQVKEKTKPKEEAKMNTEELLGTKEPDGIPEIPIEVPESTKAFRPGSSRAFIFDSLKAGTAEEEIIKAVESKFGSKRGNIMYGILCIKKSMGIEQTPKKKAAKSQKKGNE